MKTAGSVPFKTLLAGSGTGGGSARWPIDSVGQRGCAHSFAREPSIQAHPRHRRGPEPGEEADASGKPALVDSVLDPWSCQLALAPIVMVASGPSSPNSAGSAAMPVREDLQNLITSMARRVAWGGDRRKGTARIELAEGALAGATLVVHTEQRSVTVELELPAGAGASGLEQRLRERLEGRGFAASVRVA